MLFTEPRFLVFFLIVLAVHWTLRGNRSRKLWLLATSYLFYAGWDWRFLSLILTSTLVDYAAGLAMRRERPFGGRAAWLVLSLVVNLGILGFFKYCNFFIDSAGDFLYWLGLPSFQSSLTIILPVGISFYTFQTMSYTIDVYRRRLEPIANLVDFALFVAFFPQLVAGPIVRARQFLPQLREPRRWQRIDVRGCLLLFLLGFVKKSCLSDHVAPLVEAVFAAPESYTSLSIQLAVLLYAVQIYCDFSGYSDMAIACGGLLGYRLPLNFNFPYFAANVAEFWRRWHISLSTWLRDYLYVPLGGNRGSRLAVHRNLLLTMLLGGLWHGAGWNFVIWGGLHGLALVVHRRWVLWRGERPSPFWARGLGTLLTLYWVSLLWIFFRSPALPDALLMTRAFVLFDDLGSRSLDVWLWWGLAAALAAHWAMYRGRLAVRARWLPAWIFWPALGAATAVALSFAQTQREPFIYFQF